jgi:hypothetical protein
VKALGAFLRARKMFLIDLFQASFGATLTAGNLLIYYRLLTDKALSEGAKIAASLFFVPGTACLGYGTYRAVTLLLN